MKKENEKRRPKTRGTTSKSKRRTICRKVVLEQTTKNKYSKRVSKKEKLTTVKSHISEKFKKHFFFVNKNSSYFTSSCFFFVPGLFSCFFLNFRLFFASPLDFFSVLFVYFFVNIVVSEFFHFCFTFFVFQLFPFFLVSFLILVQKKNIFVSKFSTSFCSLPFLISPLSPLSFFLTLFLLHLFEHFGV